MNHKDQEIFHAINKELDRQQQTLELIASENIVSDSVLEAQGSILTNKYAEGYPHKRYYGGCEFVDEVETLAINRAKALFNAEHANVQPHSGSQANQGVFFALLEKGDKVLALNLNDGGHLTHGHPINMSGTYYEFIHYSLNRHHHIDYDLVEKLALEHRPKLIIAGGSAYAQIIDFKRFREISDKVGAYLMVDMAHYAGLIAAGVYPSPIPYADVATSTTHKTLRGPRGGLILCKKELASRIDRSMFPGIQGGPLMHVIAAKAVAFKEAQEEKFKEYGAQVIKNAKIMVEAFKKEGFNIVGGGTECHLILIDLSAQNINGKEAQALLDTVNMTTNKNSIPNETLSPMVTSGLRIGTPAITTRKMKEKESSYIVELMIKAIHNKENPNVLGSIKKEVVELCKMFPIYADLKY